MIFRPLPGLTIAAVAALALLLGLGVWQTQRAQWKADLVAELERQAALPPAPLSEALCRDDLAGPVSVDLILGPDPIRVYGAGPQGQPGWLIVQAAYAPPCAPEGSGTERRVLVQTAFETLDGDRTPAPQTLSLEPWPEIGPFTPENPPDPGEGADREFFRLDQDVAEAVGAAPGALIPLWARWDTRGPAERVAIAPADHVGYALTWFGLAAALVAIYLALHHRVGRLRFSARR